jgi:hypothetical protein
MVTSGCNYSIELHRGSPKSLPILPNLLLPSQTVKVRENYGSGHTAFSEFDSHLRNVFGVWIDLDKFYEILFFILLLEPKGIFAEYDKSAPLGRSVRPVEKPRRGITVSHEKIPIPVLVFVFRLAPDAQQGTIPP